MTGHAADARSLIDGLQGKRVTPEQGQITLALAQVHATLALVEQQRIANFIALRQADSDVLRDNEWDDTDAEIREGLGL